MRPKWQNALYRIVEQKYLQSVDGFIFNSQTTKSVVTKLLNRREPSVVAYPPTERFGSLSEEEISARSNDPQFRILFLGNVIYRKGLHTLLEALNSLVRDNISHYSLDVVGSLNAEPKYVYESERYVLTHGLSSHVKFHSSVDDGTLAIFLRRAHILVVPSSYEGFGIVYLEGMGFGLPAIGTTAGAANEIITHGENGYLIEPEDEISLAHHIKELAEDRDLLLKSSLNALQRYKSQPKWDDEARKIREFLQRMIS
jgi:glycosyltransferase involved in cell wall biosynthesis